MQTVFKCAVGAIALAVGSLPAQTALAAPPEATAPQSESARLNAWFETKYEEMLQFS
jgi:hypothetical protein